MRKLHWWDDDERETPIEPRHSKSLVSNKDKHRVNSIRRMVEEDVDRFNDHFPVEPRKALVYA